MVFSVGVRSVLFFIFVASVCNAAPGARSGTLEAASLQLGALQAQAQYPAAALQGARAASRSAASCLVTAVQYTHGQQIWRADPCEFCLCLDGEMFCWWQECPPAAPGPCPGQQPFSLCGNSSGPLEKRPYPVYKKAKKNPKKATESATKKLKQSSSKTNTKPLVTTSQDVTASYDRPQAANATFENSNVARVESTKTPKQVDYRTESWQASKSDKVISKSDASYFTAIDYNFNYTTDNDVEVKYGDSQTTTSLFDNDGKTKGDSWAMTSGGDASLSFKIGVGDGKETTRSGDASKSGCLVMGVEYHVGQSLPSTGSCLACRCAREGAGAPRVACAPRGCAPLDPAPLDDTGAF